jgi:hypothetical protein
MQVRKIKIFESVVNDAGGRGNFEIMAGELQIS